MSHSSEDPASGAVQRRSLVETTNWNAVKAMANKYGVELKSPDEIRATIRESRTREQLSQASSSEQQLERDASAQDKEEEDLGIGTPFHIFACPVDGGRTVYRFIHRGTRPLRQSQTSSLTSGTSSDNSGRHRTPRLRLRIRASRADLIDGDDAGYYAEPDSPTVPLKKDKRKTSHKSLRVARSIPTLRLWQNSPSPHDAALNQTASTAARDTDAATASTSFLASAPQIKKEDCCSSRPSKLARLVLPMPDRLESGDVMAAIVAATHMSATYEQVERPEQHRASGSGSRRKSQLPQRRSNDQHKGLGLGSPDAQIERTTSQLRNISPFGAPIMPRSDSSFVQALRMQYAPSPQGPDESLSQMIAATLQPDTSGVSLTSQTDSNDTTPGVPFEPIDTYDVIQSMWSNADNSKAPLAGFNSPASSSSQDAAESNASRGDLALPGDDPRFSLWAIRTESDDETLELAPRTSKTSEPATIYSIGQSSKQSGLDHTGTSTTSFGQSLSRSVGSKTKARSQTRSSDTSSNWFMFPSDKPFLIAASGMYLVAELTSHIDNRFMSDFFFTFRCYLAPRDLLRLLTLRFAWACAPITDAAEEAKRKIVRVRTYVVLKYWLSNFFDVDFVPDASLRSDLANWLNNLSKQQDGQGQVTDRGIVKSLFRLVMGLKSAYQQQDKRKDCGHQPSALEIDDDMTSAGFSVDLSLFSDSNDPSETRAHRNLQRKMPHSLGEHRPAESSKTHGALAHAPVPPPLPTSQRGFSRAVANTFSRFTKLKRHVHARTPHSAIVAQTQDGLDSDAQDCHDLLFIRGGLEDFLDFFGLQSKADVRQSENSHRDRSSGDESQDLVSDSTVQDETPSLGSNISTSTPASSIDLMHDFLPEELANAAFGLGITDATSEHQSEGVYTPMGLAPPKNEASNVDLLHHFKSDHTLRSPDPEKPPTSMHSALDASPAAAAFSETANLASSSNIVQIDDIDSSGDEEDGIVRRALRRLPGARDLRTATNVHDLGTADRQSMDSSLSLGSIDDVTHRSLSMYYNHGPATEAGGSAAPSRPRSSSHPERRPSSLNLDLFDPDEALRGFELVKGFRPEQLDASDEEDAGDVEAALLKLEGVVDIDKYRERQRRVEAMYMRSQEPQGDDFQAAVEGDIDRTLVEDSHSSQILTGNDPRSQSEVQNDARETISALPSLETVKDLHGAARGQPAKDRHMPEGSPRDQFQRPLPRNVYMPPPMHRSFVLDYHSETIAQQFSLIEMELFQSLAWDELTTNQWKTRHHRGQVIDWQKFYQSRARSRVEAQGRGQKAAEESSVEAIIARFNLTCNWIASEIVLTSTADMRAAVVNKFIRIAWKCYHQSNFATLSQIVIGLQSPWVERLTKTWHRVGKLEMRMLRDLKAFINPAGNFKHLRNAMREMIVRGNMEDLLPSSQPLAAAGHQSTASKQILDTGDGCIPFFGLFLADMMFYDALPPLIDPSALEVPPSSSSAMHELDSLANSNAFASLPALPKGLKLTPLVNLYKYRMLALTVKSVLALQERIESFDYTINRTVYVKALKLRCLEAEHLTVVSGIAEP